MSDNASIVQATTLMAGNGVVLLKVYDVIDQSLPLQHAWVTLALLPGPPAFGLICGFVSLGRIELRSYKAGGKLEQWMNGISMLGIGLPFGMWVLRIVHG